MINLIQVNKYCREDPSLIENYDKAIADDNQVWHCHHRLEMQNNKKFSANDLIFMKLYFNRPASELIFLTKAEHTRLHSKGKKLSEETKRKLSEAHKGKKFNLGRHHSEETKIKIRNKLLGRKIPDEIKLKISLSSKGKKKNIKNKEEL